MTRTLTAAIAAMALALPGILLAQGAEGDDVRGAQESQESSPVTGPDWMVVVSPTFGWLRNTTTFPIPVGVDDDDELEYDDYEMTDDGWGAGVTLMGYYKRVALTNVFFGFPEVNKAKLLGNITYLSVAIPTDVFVEPYLGSGLAIINTQADFFDFKDTRIDSLNNGTFWLQGRAHLGWISVDNTVVAPFPKVGAKFKIPLQHWYVTPFYSFMYEYVKTRARSGGGGVELWECADQNENTTCEDITGDSPFGTIDIRAFDSTKVKHYQSHLVGLDFFLDFHYFLQLRGKIYYNTNHDLWTTRLIGSLMFSKNMGVTAYFEYTQKITVTNMYFLIGPSFVFSPPGFMDEMMERRKKKMEDRR